MLSTPETISCKIENLQDFDEKTKWLEENTNARWLNRDLPTQYRPFNFRGLCIMLWCYKGELVIDAAYNVYCKSWYDVVDKIYKWLGKKNQVENQFNAKCPKCGAPAYVGLLSVECSMQNKCRINAE